MLLAGPPAPPSTGESTDSRMSSPALSYGDEPKTPVPKELTPPVSQEQPELFDYDKDYQGLAYGRGRLGDPAFFQDPRRVPRPMATPKQPRQLNYPGAPPCPSRQPQFKSGPMLTRQSKRTRVLTTWPDNVYGDRAQTAMLEELELLQKWNVFELTDLPRVINILDADVFLTSKQTVEKRLD